MQASPSPKRQSPEIDSPSPTAASSANVVLSKLQRLTEGMNRAGARRDVLQTMMQGMIESKFFVPAEIEAVRSQMESHAARHEELQRLIHAKSELYTNHIRNLEDIIAGRREYLAKYDEIIVEEKEIAAVLIDHQNGMEQTLKSMHASIGDLPE